MSQAAPIGRRAIRRAAGLVGALTVAGIVAIAAAPAALAHATLLFTSPAADSAVPVSPKAITLTFNQAVTLPGPAVRLAAPGGRPIALAPARQSSGPRVVPPPLPTPLPHPVYTPTSQA